MKAKKYWILATAAILICRFTILATGAGSVEDLMREEYRRYLAGLNGVYVRVVPLNPEVKKYGLTEEVLQTDAESLLRQNDIKILSYQQWRQTPGQQCLYIEVNLQIRKEMQIAAVNISVRCNQDVLLKRDPNIVCYGATTWERGCVMITRVGYVKKVHESIKEYVDEFINDYLAVNPKLKSEEQKPSDRGVERVDPKEKMWVKCTNSDCGAEYEMGQREYYKKVEDKIKPGMMSVPPLVCRECGQESIQRAKGCPKCGEVFLYGASDRRDFVDRCPKCSYSRTEERRKARKKK